MRPMRNRRQIATSSGRGLLAGGTQRTAFELVHRDGLTSAEAAEVLGTTVAAVKLRVHRASEALREILGKEVHEELEGPP